MMAAEFEPGTPRASVGTRSPPCTALFAVSGAATPSIEPFPNSSGRFDQRRASLYATKDDAVAPAPGMTPTIRPTIVPMSVAGQRSRSSRSVGNAVWARSVMTIGVSPGWPIR